MVWSPKVFWKVMTTKAATSRTMGRQFVRHRLPANFQMRMSALNQNVSFHLNFQLDNTMTSDTFSHLRCHTGFLKMDLMLWFIDICNNNNNNNNNNNDNNNKNNICLFSQLKYIFNNIYPQNSKVNRGGSETNIKINSSITSLTEQRK